MRIVQQVLFRDSVAPPGLRILWARSPRVTFAVANSILGYYRCSLREHFARHARHMVAHSGRI